MGARVSGCQETAFTTMKIYTNTTFTGHYPVGTAAIVRASNSRRAAKLLNEALTQQGLDPSVRPEDMIPLLGDKETVRILHNGDY